MKRVKVSTGDMRRKASFESRVETPNGKGGFTYSWNALCSAWVDVRFSKGREQVVDGKVVAIVTHYAYCRYDKLLLGATKARMVLTDDGMTHYYDVKQAVDMSLEHRFIELSIVEGEEP